MLKLFGSDLPCPNLPRDVDGLGNPPPEVATRAGKMEGKCHEPDS